MLFNTGARTLADGDYPHGLPPGAKDLIAELREKTWGTEDSVPHFVRTKGAIPRRDRRVWGGF